MDEGAADLLILYTTSGTLCKEPRGGERGKEAGCSGHPHRLAAHLDCEDRTTFTPCFRVLSIALCTKSSWPTGTKLDLWPPYHSLDQQNPQCTSKMFQYEGLCVATFRPLRYANVYDGSRYVPGATPEDFW